MENINAALWLSDFEKKIDCFDIIENVKKINVKTLFSEESGPDWYRCLPFKLSIDSEWKSRKKFFVEH